MPRSHTGRLEQLRAAAATSVTRRRFLGRSAIFVALNALGGSAPIRPTRPDNELPGSTVPTPPANLMPDGSFETGAARTGWSPRSSWVVSSEGGTHTTQFARFNASSDGPGSWRGPYIVCTGGQIYSLGADTRTEARGVTVQLAWFDADGGEVGAPLAVDVPSDGTWSRVTGTGAAPDDAAQLAFVVAMGGSGGAGADQVDLDAVTVAVGAYTGPMLPAQILIGDVRPDGFRVTAYAGIGSDQLRAAVVPSGSDGDTAVITEAGAVDPSGWGGTSATGLPADSAFDAQLQARNRLTAAWEDFGPPLQVRTAGETRTPWAHSTIVAGCTYKRSARTVWDHMLARQSAVTGRRPDLLVWLGDWWYDDSRSDASGVHVRLAEDAWYISSGFRDLLRRVPLVSAQWSDHDSGVGGNGRESHSSSGTLANTEAMARVMPHAFDVPGTRAHARVVGRVLYLTLDCRSAAASRFADEGTDAETLLGTAQEAWVYDWLGQARADGLAVFICSDMVWDGDADDYGQKLDAWGVSFPRSRDRLADKIVELWPDESRRPVIMFDGDLHALRIKTRSPFGGITVVGSCGAHANFGNVRASGPLWDQCWYDPVLSRPNDQDSAPLHDGELLNAYHVVDVSYAGSRCTVDITGWDAHEDRVVTSHQVAWDLEP